MVWERQVASVVSVCATLWTLACQAPLSMGFSRQEYWSTLLCPPPGDLLDPGWNLSLMSPALAARFFTWEASVNSVVVGKSLTMHKN